MSLCMYYSQSEGDKRKAEQSPEPVRTEADQIQMPPFLYVGITAVPREEKRLGIVKLHVSEAESLIVKRPSGNE